jgi:hypothetical protein
MLALLEPAAVRGKWFEVNNLNRSATDFIIDQLSTLIINNN